MPYFLIALIFTLLIGFSSCQKDNRIKPQEMVLIDGETFNETVFIDGHTYDGLIIENCIPFSFRSFNIDKFLLKKSFYLILVSTLMTNSKPIGYGTFFGILYFYEQFSYLFCKYKEKLFY